MKHRRAILTVAMFVLISLLIFVVFIFAFGGDNSFLRKWFREALGFFIYTSQEFSLENLSYSGCLENRVICFILIW